MNTVRVFVCKSCEKVDEQELKERLTQFSVPLVMLPDWPGTCPKCGSKEWLALYEYQPNAPAGKKISPVSYRTLGSGKVVG